MSPRDPQTVETQTPLFRDLGLSAPVLKALDEVGYETPSPIQALMIPHVLAGRDVLGQAQTGTGKTAAFALPLISQIDLGGDRPQILVLTPTRELAIQVAEAFKRYACALDGFHVMPIYGGQDYRTQLQQLKRGVHVVVGTPGRLMDHMRRGTLDLGAIRAVVLDEADEMLRMGFIDDVEWILEQTPQGCQTALFSATLPAAVKRIASRHLRDPQEITIQVKTRTAETIRQRYWTVSGTHKLDALTRILEAEHFDGVIVFVRTKLATTELAERLEARGYATAPLSGDIAQRDRERTVAQLKAGKIDILVATDVAARGLDVDRISHVINYDIPYDAESYIHRIGRTGRAGRAGNAILFVTPREKRLLHSIERATRQPIEAMALPSTEDINDRRVARFSQRITDTLAAEGLEDYTRLIERYTLEHDVPAVEVAAALASLVQGDSPLLLSGRPSTARARPEPARSRPPQAHPRPGTAQARRREERPERVRPAAQARRTPEHRPERARPPAEPRSTGPETGMERFRVEVGEVHGVKPGNIVGAIANEAGIDSVYMGRVEIFENYSTIELPEGMPREIFRALKKTWVSGQQLRLSRLGSGGAAPPRKAKTPPSRRQPARPHGKHLPRKKTRPGTLSVRT